MGAVNNTCADMRTVQQQQKKLKTRLNVLEILQPTLGAVPHNNSPPLQQSSTTTVLHYNSPPL